ncbi:MAG: hypothetical protein JO356_04255 [Acidobacteria bacterium]|nr:hypothetical protein [Acidobacteriota bacterium]
MTGPTGFSIAKYLVEGEVKDEQGNPLEGAAPHIGKEVAYSDSSGHFQVRFRKRGSYPLRLVPEEFISNGWFGIVRAEPEKLASQLKIVVRQVPRSSAQRTTSDR